MLECESGRIYIKDTGETSIDSALLIITYFCRYPIYAGVPMTGELVSLKEIPGGGSLFFPAFKDMAIDPLTKAFGDNVERIYEALEPLEGVKGNLGHASITLWALPNFPVTLVLWEGEDEIPPAATILYDKSASTYAHVEDVIGLGIAAAKKAINACGKHVF